MTYQDQIKSPKWQRKRLEVLELSRFKCDECQGTEKQLHVHHTYYRKNKKIWEYDNIELRCLCEDCHSHTHELNDKILQELGFLEIVASLDYKEQVLGYIQGMMGAVREKHPSLSFQTGFVDGIKNIDIEERFIALAAIYGNQK